MKKLVYLGISLVMALTMLAPATALAKAPPVQHATSVAFSAAGVITSIDAGTVKPLGKPDAQGNQNWLVTDRHVGVTLSSGTVTGSFVLTYAGVFQTPSQKGWFVGPMKSADGSQTFMVEGQTQPLTFVGPYGLPMLSISGNWQGTKGTDAKGTFSGFVVFIPDAAGHVVQIVGSQFTMTGTSSGHNAD